MDQEEHVFEALWIQTFLLTNFIAGSVPSSEKTSDCVFSATSITDLIPFSSQLIIRLAVTASSTGAIAADIFSAHFSITAITTDELMLRPDLVDDFGDVLVVHRPVRIQYSCKDGDAVVTVCTL